MREWDIEDVIYINMSLIAYQCKNRGYTTGLLGGFGEFLRVTRYRVSHWMLRNKQNGPLRKLPLIKAVVEYSKQAGYLCTIYRSKGVGLKYLCITLYSLSFRRMTKRFTK